MPEPGSTSLYVRMTREPGRLAPCPDRVLDANGAPLRGSCDQLHVLRQYGEHNHKLMVFCYASGPGDVGKIPGDLARVKPEDLMAALPAYGGLLLEHLHPERYGVRCTGLRFEAGEFMPTPPLTPVPDLR